MKLSRTDRVALAVIVAGGGLGLALFGPQRMTGDMVVDIESTRTIHAEADGRTTVIVKKKKIRRGDGQEELSVTVETSGDAASGEEFTWRVDPDAEPVTAEQFERQLVEVETSVVEEGAPLVFVDGERFEGGLEDLDPNTIDRVEVLKGEAAEELYGPEGATGVVQIFTKDGAGSR